MLLGFLVFSSCTKTAKEMEAPSKVDLLFNQLKSESQFLEYLKIVNSSMELMKTDLSKTALKDTSIIRSKTLSFEKKTKLLGISSSNNILNENYAKSSLIINKILEKYPVMSTLTKEETKELYKKAKAHYFKTKTK
jgi:hypothetical protein